MPAKVQSVFHLLEAKGIFESNSANANSRDKESGQNLYEGPVQYPKMLYHPKGETRITVPAEIIETPMGVKLVGEQRELIWQTVRNVDEETKLKAEGWHDHPAKAIEAGGGIAPAISADSRIRDQELKIKELQLELERTRANQLKEMAGKIGHNSKPSRDVA